MAVTWVNAETATKTGVLLKKVFLKLLVKLKTLVPVSFLIELQAWGEISYRTPPVAAFLNAANGVKSAEMPMKTRWR